MRRILIVTAVVVATTGTIAYLVLAPIPMNERWFALAWMAWAPVGALILWRRPGNEVALALLWIGLSWGIAFWSTILSMTDAPLTVRVWSDLVGVIMGIVPWLGIVWLVLVFPSGRLEGRLERVTATLLVVVGAIAIVSFMVTTESMDGPTGMPSPLASPTLERAVSWLVGDSGFWIVVALVAVAILSMARRWVKSSGVERHQYRWLLLGAIVFAAVLAMGQIAPEGDDGLALWILAGWSIPLVVGVAVTRYRLYDIDRIISRTVTYGLVVGLLVVVVAGLAALAGAQFQESWVVAATTLGVAAVFNPLRRRIQGLVDRRFNRSRYDAERVVEDFAASLRDGIDPDRVVDGWLNVVTETMQPAGIGVWVRGR